jgi:hypothetical protein
MAKIAFLGLGLMGTPMAIRLLEAGHDVTVWNRTSAKTGPLVDQGASAASSPAEAVAGADTAITMVATPQALEQVLFADDGVLGGLSPGQGPAVEPERVGKGEGLAEGRDGHPSVRLTTNLVAAPAPGPPTWCRVPSGASSGWTWSKAA